MKKMILTFLSCIAALTIASAEQLPIDKKQSKTNQHTTNNQPLLTQTIDPPHVGKSWHCIGVSFS